MKNTKIKKFLACLLATSCVIGLLAGCGDTTGKENSEVSNDVSKESTSQSKETETKVVEEDTGITYPLEGDNTLTWAMIDSGSLTSHYGGFQETPFIKALEEATGVKLKIETYPDKTALNLMIASGEHPDIIMINESEYSGGMAKAIADGVVEPLNDYVEYCPDLMEVLNSDNVYMKGNSTSNGDLIGFPAITGDPYLLTTCGLIIRQDMLDKVNMELPQTADQFYEVLKAFKEELNVEYPFSIYSGYFMGQALGNGMFTSPFGLVRGSFYVDNGEVHLGYAEKEYKDVLAYLKKLYDEGLMDPNFATADAATARANFMNGVSGACIDSPGGGLGTFITTMADDPTFDASGFGPLVAKEGDIPMFTNYNNAVPGYYVVITAASEKKELAAKFLNYGYTEEGHMLYNFGIEGVSYEMIDGYPTYTDLIMNNPEGLSKQQAMAGYLRVFTCAAAVTDRAYFEQYQGLPQQQQAISQWSKSDAAKYNYPNVSVAEADSAEYSKLYGDIETYIKEMSIKYITGAEDLANFESEYLATLEKMDVKRVIELKQNAYEDYQSR